MKKRPSILPWIKRSKSDLLPPINMIIATKEEDNRNFTDNAVLYQGILRYAQHNSNDEQEFLFTEMGNWLLKNLPEFVNYYVDSNANISFSARLANRRDRIQEQVDHLVNMELLSLKKYVPSRKNPRENIPVYSLTMEGKFLNCIIAARDVNKTFDLSWLIKYEYDKETCELTVKNRDNSIDKGRLDIIIEIFEIINQFIHVKESYILSFLSIFFKKCFDNNLFADIIDRFYYSYLRHIKINKGQELIRLFTKVNHPLQWIFVYPNIFIDILSEIDNETKKMLLFKFKMEIEEYYDLYYLASYPQRQTYSELHSLDSYYEYNMAIPGTEWQLLRFNNIHNHLVVTIPGICLKCKIEQPFVNDINDYLNNLKEFSNGSLDKENTFCIKCKLKSVIGKIYIPLDMVRGHEMI